MSPAISARRRAQARRAPARAAQGGGRGADLSNQADCRALAVRRRRGRGIWAFRLAVLRAGGIPPIAGTGSCQGFQEAWSNGSRRRAKRRAWEFAIGGKRRVDVLQCGFVMLCPPRQVPRRASCPAALFRLVARAFPSSGGKRQRQRRCADVYRRGG